jgi:hypothetical protein
MVGGLLQQAPTSTGAIPTSRWLTDGEAGAVLAGVRFLGFLAARWLGIEMLGVGLHGSCFSWFICR